MSEYKFKIHGELLIEDTFGDIKSRALKYSNFI